MQHKAYGDGFEKYGGKLIKTLRVMIDDRPGGFAALANLIAEEGALLGDIIKVRMTAEHIVRDVTIYIDHERQLKNIARRIRRAHGLHLTEIRDEVIAKHLGGKIAMRSRVPMESVSDLRIIYTPGVAHVCRVIARKPGLARDYTSIGNSVAIITNGTAILGLGDIGVAAGMPVMEGKAVILSKMVGISAIPILVDSKNTRDIVSTVEHIAPTFGAIQLEDIAAPQCFEVERALRERLHIPVFHDDQHGTSVVVAGALLTALRRTRRKAKDTRVVINGAGAAGIATARMLRLIGVGDIVLCDRAGAIHRRRRRHMNPFKREIAEITNKHGVRGDLAAAVAGADVFVGVSGPGLLKPEMVRTMARDSIVFALANPVPEIVTADAVRAGAAIASDGRSLNNALAFPGIFRGALDARAIKINDAMKLAAAHCIHRQTAKHDLVPDFMNREMHRRIAEVVRRAAIRTGVARVRF
ncbi:MAG: NAD-dependent malic enzyme [Planctomycetota bacterium]